MRLMKTNEELTSTARLVVKELQEDGGNGWLQLPSGKTGSVIWSNGGGWEHVSFAPLGSKTASWEDMCEIRKMFWGETGWVVEFHPPEDEYVNNKKNCLHLWRPIDEELPTPPSFMVGVKKGQSMREVIEEANRYLDEYDKRKEQEAKEKC